MTFGGAEYRFQNRQRDRCIDGRLGRIFGMHRRPVQAGFSRVAVEAELRSGSLALLRLRGWKVRRTISIVRLRGRRAHAIRE
jgi:hypothetical protein